MQLSTFCCCDLQLWHSYLRERQKAVRGLSVTNPVVAALNNTYERALVSMHKMPRIWLEYLVSFGGIPRAVSPQLPYICAVWSKACIVTLCGLPVGEWDLIYRASSSAPTKCAASGVHGRSGTGDKDAESL